MPKISRSCGNCGEKYAYDRKPEIGTEGNTETVIRIRECPRCGASLMERQTTIFLEYLPQTILTAKESGNIPR